MAAPALYNIDCADRSCSAALSRSTASACLLVPRGRIVFASSLDALIWHCASAGLRLADLESPAFVLHGDLPLTSEAQSFETRLTANGTHGGVGRTGLGPLSCTQAHACAFCAPLSCTPLAPKHIDEATVITPLSFWTLRTWASKVGLPHPAFRCPIMALMAMRAR